MKKMRKGGITRLVTDREAQYLASNGYTEVKDEKTAAPGKKDEKTAAPGKKDEK
ncbi:MAG: hypothetical protein IJ435_03740 [Clostridia bacterium]|nr:hypothetical protein [Clostridia bacterium]